MSESCLHRSRARFAIDLHPSTSGNVLKGVREQLSLLLIRCVPPSPLFNPQIPTKPPTCTLTLNLLPVFSRPMHAALLPLLLQDPARMSA